jgi:Flp pilus assembly protein TadD
LEISATKSSNYEHSGDSYFQQNDYHKAFLNYDRAVQLNPQNTNAQYKRGLTRLSAGQYQTALEEFSSILEHHPTYALGYEGQGRAYFLLSDQKHAMKSFQKAISIDARLWRSFAFLGILYDMKNQHEVARKAHRHAIQIQPDKGVLYNNLGISYLMVSDYDGAVRSFKTSLEKNYQHSKVYNNLGYALSKKGQYEEAYHAFLKAGNLSTAYNNLGCGFLANDDPENAMVYFRKAIETKPEYYKKAADNFRKAESETKNSSRSHTEN